MPAKNFTITQDKGGTYHFQGELTIHELRELKAFLDKSLKNEKNKEIAFSFAKVDFTDTAVLQLLIAFKRWIEPDTKLKISELSGEMEDILSLSGLKNAFE